MSVCRINLQRTGTRVGVEQERTQPHQQPLRSSIGCSSVKEEPFSQPSSHNTHGADYERLNHSDHKVIFHDLNQSDRSNDVLRDTASSSTSSLAALTAAAAIAAPYKKSSSFNFESSTTPATASAWRVKHNASFHIGDADNTSALTDAPLAALATAASYYSRKPTSFHSESAAAAVAVVPVRWREEKRTHIARNWSGNNKPSPQSQDIGAPPVNDLLYNSFSNDEQRFKYLLRKLDTQKEHTSTTNTDHSARSQSHGDKAPTSHPSVPVGHLRNSITKADELANRLLDFARKQANDAGNASTKTCDGGDTSGTTSVQRNQKGPTDINIPASVDHNNIDNNNNTSTMVLPPPPPPLDRPLPPPPPPRPSSSSSSGRGLQRENNANPDPSIIKSASQQHSISATAISSGNNNSPPKKGKFASMRKSSDADAMRSSFSSQTSRDGRGNNQRIAGQHNKNIQRPSQGDQSDQVIIHSPPTTNDCHKLNVRNNNVSFHKNTKKSIDNNKNGNDSKKNSSSQVMDEATEFKKLGSLSLSELESSSHSMNESSNNNNNSKNCSLLSNNHEFNSSSVSISITNFTPRPVRVTQFEDDTSNDPTSTPKGTRSMAMATKTTTTDFVSSIRQSPLDNDKGVIIHSINSMNTPVETPSDISHYKTPSSSNRASVESLPDNVDRKGRCNRHPKVKLFKKKMLGGYEQICEKCPNCLEEAPYESLWRLRAKVKRGSQQGSSQQQGQRELNVLGHSKELDSSSSSNDRGATPERSGSFRSRGRALSRSKERPKERKSRSKERGRVNESGASLLFVPSLQGKQKEDGIVTKKFARGRIRSPPPPPPRRQGSGGLHDLPPPPLFQDSLHSQHAPPGGCRRKSSDKKSSTERMRSLSVGRTSMSMLRNRAVSESSDISPSTEDKPSAFESKSLFDKGINKLSSLHNRARSSSRSRSRKRAPASSASVSAQESLASSCQRFDRIEGVGALSISDNGLTISPRTTKKSVAAPVLSSHKHKFDKKSGRCKNHPSIVLAQKSKFSKGWDIVRDVCPLCNESKTNSGGGDDDQFSEISKKKMNALLRKSSDGAQSFDMPSSDITDTPSRHNSSFHKKNQESGDHAPGGTPAARVSRMPYTTPLGESGWYTGEVNQSGKPDGQGRMRSKTGNQTEGEWSNGYSVEFLERKGRMKSGFGTNVAKWKQERDINVARGSSGSGGSRRLGSSPSTAVAKTSSKAMYQEAQYQAPAPAPAYHPSHYGMVPSGPAPHQGAAPAAPMMTAGMWNQSPSSYQHGYPTQSPGGGSHHMGHPPAYHQHSSYHQT
mmetsp:Transcript_5464/g.12453  ORF Transcript_5464/g.12453 Transcript_5464/m.12453 type:complete len:1300 (-) Transcript_5464:205-4104(-)